MASPAPVLAGKESMCPTCEKRIPSGLGRCPLCGERFMPRSTSPVEVAALVLGGASVVLPYFAAVFMAPVALICGLVAYSRDAREVGILGILLAIGGFVNIAMVSAKLTEIIR